MTDTNSADLPKIDGLDARYLRILLNGKPPPVREFNTLSLSALKIPVIPGLAFPFKAPVTFYKNYWIAQNAPIYSYEAAKKCIYCGEEKYSSILDRQLGDEHIVNVALGARMVIPLASCLTHERCTSAIETKIMQNLFDPTRKQLNILGRNKKPILKGNFIVSHMVDGKDVKMRLPIEDHPTILFLTKLAPPGILTGRPKWLHGIVGVWVANLNAEESKIQKFKMQNVASPGLDTVLFAQMLSKIAHSFAAAEVLTDNFEPFLPEFISSVLGKKENDDRRFYYVGGDVIDHPPTPCLHEIGLGLHEVEGQTYIVAKVRLFAFMGAPTYYVTVGKVSESNKAAVIARLSRNNSSEQAQ